MLRSLLLTATMTMLATAAAAQDARPQAALRNFQNHHARLERPCDNIDGLSICAERAGVSAFRRVAKEKPGQLTRFTRLAGMFMGRVDAADWGPLRVRFNLQLR